MLLLLSWLVVLPAVAQTTSTLCQAQQVAAGSTSVIDLRLIGCGDGYPDNLLWHLDRADSPNGALDTKVTRTATGKGVVVYMCDTGVWRDHDEFARPDGSAVIGAIYPPGKAATACTADPALSPCSEIDADIVINGHGTATASVVAGRTVGVAPDAKLVAVYMPTAGTKISGWLAAFDLIIRHAWDPATPPFRTAIVNLSFTPGYAVPADPPIPGLAVVRTADAAAFELKMRQMIEGVDRDGQPDPNGKKFLFVTVAGNYLASSPSNQCAKNMDTNLYPAVLGSTIDGLITVGGIDSSNRIWDRSCRGAALDILAPAANMLVASIGGRDHYRSDQDAMNSGTSFAGSVRRRSGGPSSRGRPDADTAAARDAHQAGRFACRKRRRTHGRRSRRDL